MITTVDLREHVLTAAEKYDLPLTVKQADTLANHLTIHANRGPAPTVKLTDVQMAALVGIASGETAAETARRICRTEHTVKTHRRTLFAALGARSAGQAVAIAMELGLIVCRKPVSGVSA
jgi:DNA-binding CsgD family transcriptional regulator